MEWLQGIAGLIGAIAALTPLLPSSRIVVAIDTLGKSGVEPLNFAC